MAGYFYESVAKEIWRLLLRAKLNSSREDIIFLNYTKQLLIFRTYTKVFVSGF